MQLIKILSFCLFRYDILHNPLMPVGNYSYQFFICCPRDCVSRHNGGTSGAPLKPLRVDSALKALSTLRGLRGAPEVPPICREAQSLGQQMLNAPFGINGIIPNVPPGVFCAAQQRWNFCREWRAHTAAAGAGPGNNFLFFSYTVPVRNQKKIVFLFFHTECQWETKMGKLCLHCIFFSIYSASEKPKCEKILVGGRETLHHK